MQEAAKMLQGVKVRDKANGGHGHTILTGYREAAKDGFDWVFQIDSDDEMGPEKFNELWERRSEYDFLVGIRDGRVQALPRKIISFVSRLCVRIFYGKSVWDVNTPYRLMRMSAFRGFYSRIPLTTFAPNVILSGLAARHKLRCFEMNVPQHDRQTGEVSIKKWKLFKAAAKSFWQTICFSLTAETVVPVLLSMVFCTLSVVSIDYISHPLFDECGTTDTAANVVLRGVWESHVWSYSYNPLHLFLLEAWLKIFGITHVSVCGLGIFTAFVLSLVFRRVLASFGILSGVWTNIVFITLFWGGWQFSEIMALGRIDMLAALFTVLTIAEVMQYRGTTGFAWKIYIFSFLMMLSAVYPVPLVMIFMMVRFAIASDKLRRKTILRQGFACAMGVASAYVLSCLYYACHRSLFRFVHTYFSYNATLSGTSENFIDKVVHSYSHDMMALVLFIVAAVAMPVFSRRLGNVKWQYLVFIGLIPPLAKFCGRYEGYYSWMFYLPVVVLLVSVLNKIDRKKTFCQLIFGILIANLCFHTYLRFQSEGRYKLTHENAWSQVDAIANELCPGRDVVISDLAYYYPLIQHRVRVWYQKKLTKAQLFDYRYILTPRQKFENFIAKIWENDESKKSIMELYDKVERSYEKEPPEDAIFLPIEK